MRKNAPSKPHSRGPWWSRIAPIGKAATFVPDGSDSEHEIQVDLDTGILANTTLAIPRADFSIGALSLQDRLYGSVAKHDPGSEEAVDDSDEHLY